MHIQIVTFSLDGVSDADLRAGAEALAPQFAGLPGLHSKVWIADPASNTYGGVYTWEGRSAMRAYLEGELYATALRDNPTFSGLRSRAFGVIDGATRVTGADRTAVPA